MFCLCFHFNVAWNTFSVKSYRLTLFDAFRVFCSMGVSRFCNHSIIDILVVLQLSLTMNGANQDTNKVSQSLVTGQTSSMAMK